MFPWIAALLLAALGPALIVAGLSANLMILPLAFPITLGHSIILGLPEALVYRAKRWTRLSAVIFGAFLVGSVPGGILIWPLTPSSRTSASVDGVPTIIDGVPTLAGWLGYLKAVGMLGGLGAVGGVIFWLTLKYSGVLAVTDSGPAGSAHGRSRIGMLLAGAAVAASVAVATIPSITKDRSCHNLFRDGRRSVAPKVSIDLDVSMDDWPRLTTLLEEFSASHAMSFQNLSQSKPVVKVLGLSACSEQGQVITAHDQRWAPRKYAPIMAGGGVPIGVYDLSEGTDWRLLAQQLVAVLDTEWRGKVRFRGGDGRFIPGSTALDSQPSR